MVALGDRAGQIAAVGRATAEVELDVVARLGGAIGDRDERRSLAAELLELALDELVRHRVVVARRLEHERIRKRGLRTDPHGRREVERLTLVGQLLPVDVGLLDRLQAADAERVGVPALEVLAEGLVEHLFTSEALEDDLRRHSALAESGHPDLVREMSQRVLEIVLDALRRNLDIEARAVTVEEGGLRPHGSQTVAEAPGSSGGLEHSSATALVWPPRGRGGTVDAPDLGSGERELVEVQVLSPALACWRRARRNGSRAQYHRRRAGDRRSCRPVRAGQVARRGRPGSRAPAGTRGGGCARLDRCERPNAGDRARRPVRLQRVR